MGEISSAFNAGILEDLRLAQKSRAFFKAAGISLQLWEAYGLDRSSRGLLRHELARHLEAGNGGRPPDVHHNLLEKLRLIRDQAGPVIKKLRQFLPRPPGNAPEYESHEMAIAFLMSSGQGRDLANRWLSDAMQFRDEAAGEMHKIVELVEAALAVAAGPRPTRAATAVVDPAPSPPPAEAEPPPAPPVPEPPPLLGRPPARGAPKAPSPAVPEAEIPAPAPVAEPAPAPATVEAPAPPPAQPLPRPAVPEDVTAKAGNAKVSLTWKPQSDATSYIVRRRTASGGPDDTRAVGLVECSYTDFAVMNGVRYYFVVVAKSVYEHST